MHSRRYHSRGRGRRHAHEISASAGSHSLNVESRQAPGAATHIKKSHQPAELYKVEGFWRIRRGSRANSPSVCEKRGSHPEADHVCKRIEFSAKRTFGFHSAGDSSVHGIEDIRKSNRASRAIEVAGTSIEDRKDRVVTAKKIGDGQGAGQQVDTAAQAMIPKGITGLRLLAHRIYVVEFHFARMLSPPFTNWPF